MVFSGTIKPRKVDVTREAMHVSIKITKSIVNEHLTIYTQKYKPTKINETVVK